MDASLVIQILRSFAEHGVEYKLVGAIALAVQGITRATQDIDFFVRPTEENLGRVRRALGAIWEDPSIDEIRAEDLSGEYPTIRYGPPDGDFYIDLLSRLDDVFDYEAIESETIEFEGVPVHVATPRMLHQMKRSTLRLQDQADAEALREKFGLEND